MKNSALKDIIAQLNASNVDLDAASEVVINISESRGTIVTCRPAGFDEPQVFVQHDSGRFYALQLSTDDVKREIGLQLEQRRRNKCKPALALLLGLFLCLFGSARAAAPATTDVCYVQVVTPDGPNDPHSKNYVPAHIQWVNTGTHSMDVWFPNTKKYVAVVLNMVPWESVKPGDACAYGCGPGTSVVLANMLHVVMFTHRNRKTGKLEYCIMKGPNNPTADPFPMTKSRYEGVMVMDPTGKPLILAQSQTLP